MFFHLNICNSNAHHCCTDLFHPSVTQSDDKQCAPLNHCITTPVNGVCIRTRKMDHGKRTPPRASIGHHCPWRATMPYTRP